MSTASASAAAPAALPTPKPRHTLSCTRSGLYLLEAFLKENGPCRQGDQMHRIVLWNKVWAKVRGPDSSRHVKLSWMPDGHDIEKPIFKDEGESDAAFQKRGQEWNAAYKAWQEAPATLELSEKYRDVCKETVKWVWDNMKDGKARVQLDTSVHSASLLITLGLAGDETLADDDA